MVTWKLILVLIKFVTVQHAGGFHQVHRFPPPNKTDSHDIAEIL